MLSRTQEVLEKQNKRGYSSWVVKSTGTDLPNRYTLDYIYVDESSMSRVMSESFSSGGKVGETAYASPTLMIEFPLSVGKKWTDTKSISGYDENIELIGMQMTVSSEVLREESVTVPAGTFECWVIKSTEILDGTHVIVVENQHVVARATTVTDRTGWYSESVKNFVKENVVVNSILTISELQTALETRTETRLSSYSVK